MESEGLTIKTGTMDDKNQAIRETNWQNIVRPYYEAMKHKVARVTATSEPQQILQTPGMWSCKRVDEKLITRWLPELQLLSFSASINCPGYEMDPINEQDKKDDGKVL
uniref:Uncharacterized protein n=1 Tax=Angiostrongylus cantonensis TaxID=6313 RepID=A0A0K0D8I1_ANGCA